jgi:hypothetical protein
MSRSSEQQAPTTRGELSKIFWVATLELAPAALFLYGASLFVENAQHALAEEDNEANRNVLYASSAFTAGAGIHTAHASAKIAKSFYTIGGLWRSKSSELEPLLPTTNGKAKDGAVINETTTTSAALTNGKH